MSSNVSKRFILVDWKSFDVACDGKKLDGSRISENGRGSRTTISLNKAEAKWLVDALSDFYWLKSGVMRGKKLIDNAQHLYIVLCRN